MHTAFINANANGHLLKARSEEREKLDVFCGFGPTHLFQVRPVENMKGKGREREAGLSDGKTNKQINKCVCPCGCCRPGVGHDGFQNLTETKQEMTDGVFW